VETADHRRKLFSERFQHLIKQKNFQWFIVKKDNENPKRGCYTSHQTIINEAKKQGLHKIMVFEDDADLLVPYEQFITEVNKINGNKAPEYWTIILLGYFSVRAHKYRDEELEFVKVGCALGTHTYVVNLDNIDYIPDYDFDVIKNEVDVFFLCDNLTNPEIAFSNQFKDKSIYGKYPVLTKQNVKGSTITPERDLLGTLNYDRNSIVKISLNINPFTLCFLMIVLFVIFVIIIIVSPKIYT